MNISKHTQIIKYLSAKYDFDHCGIAKAVMLDDDARRLENWLKQGFHGGMQYMENYFDLRIDPRKIVPGAKSVITLLKNYYPQQQQSGNSYKVSKYAYGKDYHEVIREKLRFFCADIQEQIGTVNGRGFVDSAPVLERAWAVKSGLGWIGKNGNLLTKNSGSFYFIATLIVDLELEYDDAFAKDYCGSCNRCVTACPTEAILPNKVINGSKCISYYTIELKEEIIPSEMKGKFQDWMFGCDVCQDVCPWNRFAKPHTEEAFQPVAEIIDFSKEDWEEITEEGFRSIFKNSPLKRSKFKGISRNISFLKLSKPKT